MESLPQFRGFSEPVLVSRTFNPLTLNLDPVDRGPTSRFGGSVGRGGPSRNVTTHVNFKVEYVDLCSVSKGSEMDFNRESLSYIGTQTLECFMVPICKIDKT